MSVKNDLKHKQDSKTVKSLTIRIKKRQKKRPIWVAFFKKTKIT